jgi:DNA-binding beta-propeller fold protein YncE
MKIVGAAFVLSAGSFFFVGGCEKDSPAGPPDGMEMSGYEVYVAGWDHDPIIIYNTKDMTITDTILLADLQILEDMVVTSDGKYLVMTTNTSGGPNIYHLTAYDLNTLDTVLNIRSPGRLEISGSGNFIAVYGNHSDSIIFLDGHTLEVLFSDKRMVEDGRFLYDDSKFYCVWRSNQIGIYDMTGDSLEYVINYSDNSGYTPYLFKIQPTVNGERLYLLASYNIYCSYVLLYVPATDSTIFDYFIGPPAGDIRLTPDGKQVIVTDPGNLMAEINGSDNVLFFNARLHEPTSPTLLKYTSPEWPSAYPGDIAITPDSRYAIVASAWHPAFGMIDLNQHQFVDFKYDPIEAMALFRVSCPNVTK